MKQRMEITFETEETILIRQPTPGENLLCPECQRMIEAKKVSPITMVEPSFEELQDTRGSYAKDKD